MHWYVDGTFFVVPQGFYQLIVIVIYNEVMDAYIPACFCLASSKNENIYYEIFTYIKNFILNNCFEMTRITLDFEKGAFKGMKKAFPGANFLGCGFHFVQALIRKCDKKGLMNESLEKGTNKIIGNICSILETGIGDLSTYLDQLENDYNQNSTENNCVENVLTKNKKYTSFINYIKNTWLPRFNDGMLNYAHRDREEWTNNAIESYHRRLQQKLTKHPNIQQFVLELQNEEQYFSNKFVECLRYGVTSKRKRKHVNTNNCDNERIINIGKEEKEVIFKQMKKNDYKPSSSTKKKIQFFVIYLIQWNI